MPTIFSHPVPVFAVVLLAGARNFPFPLILFGIMCSILPDIDVLGFRLGIPYDDVLGHRGFFHSLAFAVVMGIAGALSAPLLRTGRGAAFCVGIFAVASHIFLDAMTNGGLGVAAFWPFDEGRYFFGWRPIKVSPLDLHVFFTRRGVQVMLSELRWVWLPCLLAGGGAFLARHMLNRRGEHA